MDNIPADQISYRKNVGTLDGDKVIEIGLKGGLCLMVAVHGNRVETLSIGSHRGICRHIAKKLKPNLQLTELSKGDYVSEEHFAFLLPQYEELTHRFRVLEGSEKE